ncbi:MAG: PilZN3 domain-containing protein, partial [Alkalispirochaeta sp.]
MDRVLLERKTRDYQDLSIRMDSYLFRKFGLVKNAVNLKIDNYYLNCIPFDLSLDSCRAISILGGKEIVFFSEYIGTTQNLNLTLHHPGFSKPISLFLRVKLQEFKQHNPDSNVCIIEMQFVSVPNDFKEIFVGVADELTFCRELYNDDARGTASVGVDTLRDHLGSPYFTLRVEGSWERTGKVIALSARSIVLFVDTEGLQIAGTQPVEVEYESPSVTASGVVREVKSVANTPGYAAVAIDLQYAAPYVDLVGTLLPKG